MNKSKMLWAFLSFLYMLMHASEGIELENVIDFAKKYTYLLKDIAPEHITQIAVNSSFAYLLTKQGNIYKALSSEDLSNATWQLLPGSSDVSLIGLFPERDTLNKRNILYATHNYIFKDRMFLYDSATTKSVPLTTHNRAIYKIGSVFDKSIYQSCAISGSVFPSIQLRRKNKISPLKNAYLAYAQDTQLVYAALPSNKDGNKKDDRINLFERIIGTKLSYAIYIVWDTTALDSLTLIDTNKKAFIKTDSENELVVDINNSADLPLVAMSNVQDKIKTVAVVMQHKNELKIVFNYWLDERVIQEMLKKENDLTKTQELAITLQNSDIRSRYEIKKMYYKSKLGSILNTYEPITYSINIKMAEPVQAVYLTYSSLQSTLDNVLNNENSHILMLVYSKNIECIFVNDLKSGNPELRKCIINFQNKTILTTFFNTKQNILFCVTKDQQDNVFIESRNITEEIKKYYQIHKQVTKERGQGLAAYQEALKK